MDNALTPALLQISYLVGSHKGAFADHSFLTYADFNESLLIFQGNQ